MPVLPKSFIILGAGVLTARMSARLRRKNAAAKAQQKTLPRLLKSIARTEQGRAFGLTAGTTAAAFVKQVPLQTYEMYLPQIERMQRGEADVLWPGPCHLYAASTGTTTGRARLLPVTAGMVQHFRRAGLTALLYYTARAGHAGVFRGRHLFLSGPTTLTRVAPNSPFEACRGNLSGIAALHLPRWLAPHLYEPGHELAALEDGPAKVEAVAAHAIRCDISLLAGIPGSLLTMAEAVQQQATRGQIRPAHLQAVWPNLECLIHGGAAVAPYLDELQRACGPGVDFHEVYPAAEGFIAAQDADAARGLRLIADAGIYYEFLPLKDFDDTRLSQLAGKTVPLAGVQAGVDYVLIMTTPAGLCRYIIGDVVRFISTEPPRLVYVGRTKLQLGAFGERVVEKEITDALIQVCAPHQWTIVNFHVAPLFTPSLTGQHRGRHEWWVELKPGTVDTPTGPLMATALDAELRQLNPDYATKRRDGVLEAPVVRLVMPGIFKHWMRYNGKWSAQDKMPRCRSDRQVADELAQIARFTSD